MHIYGKQIYLLTKSTKFSQTYLKTFQI